jgi:hypothetical protein
VSFLQQQFNACLLYADLIVLRPVEGGHGARLKGWWDEVRGKLPRQSEGVKLPEVGGRHSDEVWHTMSCTMGSQCHVKQHAQMCRSSCEPAVKIHIRCTGWRLQLGGSCCHLEHFMR